MPESISLKRISDLYSGTLHGLSTEKQRLTTYFALFIWSALCNGFNVRDDSFEIMARLGRIQVS